MKKLKQYLYGIISAVTPLYDVVAPEGTPMPYATYNMGASSETHDREDITLIIDLWDNKPTDTTALDTLNQTIKDLLNDLTYVDEDFGVTLYLLNRQPIPDPDKTIRRVQLLFNCSTYFK